MLDFLISSGSRKVHTLVTSSVGQSQEHLLLFSLCTQVDISA